MKIINNINYKVNILYIYIIINLFFFFFKYLNHKLVNNLGTQCLNTNVFIFEKSILCIDIRYAYKTSYKISKPNL